MKIGDLKLKPGDSIIELKNVVIRRADGTSESYTVSVDITPVEPVPVVMKAVEPKPPAKPPEVKIDPPETLRAVAPKKTGPKKIK